MPDNIAVVLKLIGNVIQGIENIEQQHGLDAGFDVVTDGYIVFHKGRSFLISLVTKSRIGASLNLSRRLCGSGAGDEVPSGQSRCILPQRKAEKSRDYSGLKAASRPRPRIQQQSLHSHRVEGEQLGAALNFEISKHTLQLRGGSGVDALRPLFWERICGGIKEM